MELSCGSFCSINCVVRRVKLAMDFSTTALIVEDFFSLFLYPKSIFFLMAPLPSRKCNEQSNIENITTIFLSTYSSPWIPRAYSQHLLTKFNIYSAMLRTVIAQKVC